MVVESGLLTVLDLAKTAPQQSKLDQITLLLAIKGETGMSFIIDWDWHQLVLSIETSPIFLLRMRYLKYFCSISFNSKLGNSYLINELRSSPSTIPFLHSKCISDLTI